jgi:hypothetical protein
MSIKFIGNCLTINWQQLVDSIATQEGEARTYGVDFYQNTDGRFDEVIKLWNQAGYDKSGTVEWINYYPGKHFDELYVKQFEEYVGVKCIRAWMSKIRPGRYAPYHTDIDDHEEEYLKQGELVRFTAHPCLPTPGQVLIVDNHVFHNEIQGNIYQWPNHLAWHAGGNCSFKPKYLFNFLGVKQ